MRDFHMHGPCTREGISMHTPPGHTDNPGASLRQGVPSGYPLEQGILLLPSIPPQMGLPRLSQPQQALHLQFSPSGESATRVPPGTPASPGVLPRRLSRSRVSQGCLPARAPTWTPAAAAGTDTPTVRARTERTRRLIGMQLGVQRWQQITP